QLMQQAIDAARARAAADVLRTIPSAEKHQRVANDPHRNAQLLWDEIPHFYGISSRLPPERIAQLNEQITAARSTLTAYRKQYGDAGEARMGKEDKAAYSLVMKYEPIEAEALQSMQKALDRKVGGA